MLDLNFITPEYRLKLLMKKLLQLSILIVFLIIGLEIGISQFLKARVSKIKMEVKDVDNKISKIIKVNKELEEKTKLIPDLTSKIQGFGDLLQERGASFSEVLSILSQYTPKKVWYKKLEYKDNQIILNGIAAKSSNTSAELNVFSLERNLKDSGKFAKVQADYITSSMEKENEVKTFQYSLTLLNINVGTPEESKEVGDKK